MVSGQLNADALTDLVILHNGSSAPAIAQTAQNQRAAPVLAPEIASFSNLTPIIIGDSASPPTPAEPALFP